MFALGASRYNDWYVIPGTPCGGRQVDLIAAVIQDNHSPREVALLDEAPNEVGYLANKYWRKYLGSLRTDSDEPLRPYFGRYVCQAWNARHTGDEQLVDLQLVVVEEMTLPDYQRTEPEETVLLEHSCS